MDANRLSQGQLSPPCGDRPAPHQVPALVRRLRAVTFSGTHDRRTKNFSLWEAQLLDLPAARDPGGVVPARLALLGDGADAPMASGPRRSSAGVATLLILYRVLDTPGDADRELGLFLGLSRAGDRGGRCLSLQDGPRSRAQLNSGSGSASGRGDLRGRPARLQLPSLVSAGQDAGAWEAFGVGGL